MTDADAAAAADPSLILARLAVEREALGGGGALLVHGILRRASAARADAALRELAR